MNECPLQGSRRDLRPARPFGMDGLDAVAAALSHPDSLAAVVNPTDCDAPCLRRKSWWKFWTASRR